MLRTASLVLVLSGLLAPFATACGGDEVNCDNLCKKALACEVSFAPSDDPKGAKVKAGDRTDLESCALGCAENPRVTVDSATCADQVKISTPEQCQEPMLKCFGAKP